MSSHLTDAKLSIERDKEIVDRVIADRLAGRTSTPMQRREPPHCSTCSCAPGSWGERKCIWTPLPEHIDAYEACASIHHVGRDDEGPALPAYCEDCGGAVVVGPSPSGDIPAGSAIAFRYAGVKGEKPTGPDGYELVGEYLGSPPSVETKL